MKILICDNLNQQVYKELETIGDCVDISKSISREKDLANHIKDCEIVVIRSATKLTKEVLDKAEQLKIIARCGVGIDNVDLDFAKSKNIFVTNSPSANLISVVELTVALIISVSRKLSLADSHLKKGEWNRSQFLGNELYGKTLGIVGFGKAGRLVADRMKSFGMSIVFYDPYVTDWNGSEESIKLDDLLRTADVVSIHVIKTKDTENLISKDMLDLLKPSSVIINTSRGGVLDEDYLFELLESEKIFGAGLDVYSNEPPKNVDRYNGLNLVTTPHTVSYTHLTLPTKA